MSDEDPQSKTPLYSKPEVDALLRALSEATRATPHANPDLYVPPAGSDQAAADYHHFVFGQRGSGKSSLLRHLERDLSASDRIAIWADQEVYTALQYPDVIVSVALDVMEGLRAAVLEVDPLTRRRRLKRWLKSHIFRREPDDLHAQLSRAIQNLHVLKGAPIDRRVEWSHKVGSETTLGALGRLSVAPVEASARASKRVGQSTTAVETIESSKEEYLEHSLREFRTLVSDAAKRCGGGFVFLDDLYLLRREDQPRVLGYVHRLVKDTGLWLKIGSIRYLTTTYRTSNPPVGMQLGQDAHDIALDNGVRMYETTKKFLEQILSELSKNAGVAWQDLLTEGARGRLMLASGGVARDHIRLTDGAIRSARERGPSSKAGTERVIVEDVNTAAGRIAPSKLDELKRDAPEEAVRLEQLVLHLVQFCRANRSAYFLVDTQDSDLSQDMEALQHLRFAHLLEQSESVPDRQSQRFNVWLLDVAQLSAQRATQQMDFQGWQQREKRRNRRLIYSKDWEAGTETTSDREANEGAKGRDEETTLFDVGAAETEVEGGEES